MANSVVHPSTRLPFAPVTNTQEATVPRGGQMHQRTVLIGGRLENALRKLPPPPPLPAGPLYRRALERCGVTQDISPDREIEEGVLVQVLRLNECDVPGADLFSQGTHTEQETLDLFRDEVRAGSVKYTVKQLGQWLQTRHVSKTKLRWNGKTEVCLCTVNSAFHTHFPVCMLHRKWTSTS